MEERLTHVESVVEGMGEANAATSSTVDALRRIRLTGYIQGRYEWQNDADFGLNAGGTPRGRNRFYVRRARLKATYVGDLSEYVFQIDAADGVALRDAEASLVLNELVFPGPEPWEVKLTFGQFKVPFGFEVLQSSGDREMPERSRVMGAFFPGERDRGVRLTARYGMFRLASALINGNFTNDAVHGAFDPTSWKDIVARLGIDTEHLVVGASIQWGHTLRQDTARNPPMVPFPIYSRFDRLRVGADAQTYWDIPGLGGLSVRGEVIWGNDVNMDFTNANMPTTMKNACRDVKSFGWYGTVVQNFGDHLGLAFRFDQFDPYRKGLEGCMAMMGMPQLRPLSADSDRVDTFGVALLGYISGNLKATINYEHVEEQVESAPVPSEPKRNGTLTDDIIRVQMQAKF